MASQQLFEAVPFYRDLTLDGIGGDGIRWPTREPASAFPAGTAPAQGNPPLDFPLPDNGALKLGRYRPIWAAPEVEISPALQFTVAHQQLELSPEDARRLGIADRETVQISQNGTHLQAEAVVRTGVAPGVGFLADGIERDSANLLTEALIEVRKA
jgi:NADH-quinone oxidoreductase subunit G